MQDSTTTGAADEAAAGAPPPDRSAPPAEDSPTPTGGETLYAPGPVVNDPPDYTGYFAVAIAFAVLAALLSGLAFWTVRRLYRLTAEQLDAIKAEETRAAETAADAAAAAAKSMAVSEPAFDTRHFDHRLERMDAISTELAAQLSRLETVAGRMGEQLSDRTRALQAATAQAPSPSGPNLLATQPELPAASSLMVTSARPPVAPAFDDSRLIDAYRELIASPDRAKIIAWLDQHRARRLVPEEAGELRLATDDEASWVSALPLPDSRYLLLPSADMAVELHSIAENAFTLRRHVKDAFKADPAGGQQMQLTRAGYARIVDGIWQLDQPGLLGGVGSDT